MNKKNVIFLTMLLSVFLINALSVDIPSFESVGNYSYTSVNFSEWADIWITNEGNLDNVVPDLTAILNNTYVPYVGADRDIDLGVNDLIFGIGGNIQLGSNNRLYTSGTTTYLLTESNISSASLSLFLGSSKQYYFDYTELNMEGNNLADCGTINSGAITSSGKLTINNNSFDLGDGTGTITMTFKGEENEGIITYVAPESGDSGFTSQYAWTISKLIVDNVEIDNDDIINLDDIIDMDDLSADKIVVDNITIDESTIRTTGSFPDSFKPLNLFVYDGVDSYKGIVIYMDDANENRYIYPTHKGMCLGYSRSPFKKVYIDTMVIAAGSITDSGGLIDFGNENLKTLSNLTSNWLNAANLNISDSAYIKNNFTAKRFEGDKLAIGNAPVGFGVMPHLYAKGAARSAFIYQNTIDTNNMRTGANFVHETTQDMVDGFGINMIYSITDSSGTKNDIAYVGAIRDGADNSGKIVFVYYDTGTATVGLSINSTGTTIQDDLHIVGNNFTLPDANGVTWTCGVNLAGEFTCG